MTIETDLYALLGAMVGSAVSNRIHYYRASQPDAGKAPTMPFVVYTMTTRTMLADLDGVTNRAATTFQIDVCAATFATAKAIARTIRTALAEWPTDEDSPVDATLHEDEEDFLDEAVEPAVPRVTQVWVIHHLDA